MFRPRQVYLMSRRNEPIEIRLGNTIIVGEIVTTIGAGFGIRFEHEMDEQLLSTLLATFGDRALRAA